MITFDQLEQLKHTGTTAATANRPMLAKPISGFPAALDVVLETVDEQVYVELPTTSDKAQRPGVNSVAVATFETGATLGGRIAYVTNDIVVVAYEDDDDSDNCKVRAYKVDQDGSVEVAGAIATINAAVSTYIDICKVADAKFAVVYQDDGGDDYGGIRICTVNTSTLAITMGTEVLFNSAVTNYCTCASPADNVVFVAYEDVNKGECVAATISGTVPTFGTKVEFDSADVSVIDCEQIDYNKVAIVYADDDASTGEIVVCTLVLAVITAGTGVTFNADATLSPRVTSPEPDVCAIVYEDDGGSDYGQVVICTVATRTVTAGTAVTFSGTNAIGVCDVVAENRLTIYALYRDEGDSNYLRVVRITISGTTPTVAGYIDDMLLSAVTVVAVVAMPPVLGSEALHFAVAFTDAGDSNQGKIRLLTPFTYLLDVRSNVASRPFTLYELVIKGPIRT